MKKFISLALYFSLFFLVSYAFPDTASAANNTHEVYELENASIENITPIELMRWCNGLENNNPALTENGVYEIHGNKLLSVNPNTTYFLCTQDQIEHGILSPQDISSYQGQPLYLAIKQGAVAERPSNAPNTSQQNPSSVFNSQGSSFQKQQAEEQSPTLQQSSIEDTFARMFVCHIARITGMLTGAYIGQTIAVLLGTGLVAGGAITIVCTLAGLAVGWSVGAYIGHYFFG